MTVETRLMGETTYLDDPSFDPPIARGARVRKVAEDPGGDLTPLGERGTVVGAVVGPDGGPAWLEGRIMYFIEWDHLPDMAVGAVAWKVAAA